LVKVKTLRAIYLTLLLMLAAAPAQEAEIKLRNTSYYLGTPLNFYIQVTGVREAPQPQLFETPQFEVRYINGAASSRQDQQSYTFTYEAVPLIAGKLQLPGGAITLGGKEVKFAPVEIEVKTPEITEEMDLEVNLSQTACYAGEPILVTFHWTSNLSFNGVKAVNLRAPILRDPRFKVKEPPNPVDPNGENAIGVPVSEERVIAQFAQTERAGKPAIRLTFQKIIIPQQPGDLPLLLEPASVFCSYVAPRNDKFKGAPYPSYFNNEFFNHDLTGEYQRLAVRSKPMTLQVRPLPPEGKPANFSGIVGAFQLKAAADPTTVEVSNPITLTLSASGYPFPHVLEMPALRQQAALTASFMVGDGAYKSRVANGNWEAVQFVRPLRPDVTAIPAIEVNYFNPATQTYDIARTQPIPITIAAPAPPPVAAAAPPVDEAANAFDTTFSDGSRLQNEIIPAEGGIFYNYRGPQLLLAQTPVETPGWFWFAILAAPVLAYLAVRWLTRDWRFARRDPQAARRQLAFRKFERALSHLGPEHELKQLSDLVRNYLAERFDLPAFAAGPAELRRLAERASVEPKDAAALAELVASADAVQFSGDEYKATPVEKERVKNLVRQLEQFAIKSAAVIVFLGACAQSLAEEALTPAQWLERSESYFDLANQTALVDPAKAKGYYRQAAEAIETLLREKKIVNGELLYNLGNAYFLGGDPGRAILSYRRAQLYLPNDPRLAGALKHARAERPDFYPETESSRWRKYVFFWHDLLSRPWRLGIIAGCLAGVWGAWVWRLFRPAPWIQPVTVWLGSIAVLLVFSDWVHSRQDPGREAVILETEVMPRKGDSYIYDPALVNPIHAGLEVRLLDRRREWLHIGLADGSTGWVLENTVESIAPSKISTKD